MDTELAFILGFVSGIVFTTLSIWWRVRGYKLVKKNGDEDEE